MFGNCRFLRVLEDTTCRTGRRGKICHGTAIAATQRDASATPCESIRLMHDRSHQVFDAPDQLIDHRVISFGTEEDRLPIRRGRA